MIVSPNNSSNNCVPQKINVDVKGLDIISQVDHQK